MGSAGTIARLRSAQVGGRRRVGTESQHMGATPAGARDASRRLLARTVSWTQAINVRSETRLAVTAAITPLTNNRVPVRCYGGVYRLLRWPPRRRAASRPASDPHVGGCHLGDTYLYIAPRVTCPSRRYKPANLSFARRRGWRVHPARLQLLGFTHRRYHSPPCHPSLTIITLQ